MTESHWNRLYQSSPVQEPESPRHEQVAAGVTKQLSAIDGRILLLGASPTLSRIGSDLIAVDRTEAVVRARWPGNTETRRVVIADWLQLPFPAGSFAACIGDGTANALPWPAVGSLYESVSRVLRPGGTFVSRTYLTPDAGETIADVARAARQGQCSSFVYFKFRLGMAIAAGQSDPSVPVQSIYAAFNTYFPDRGRLPEVIGWSPIEIDKIDLYQSSIDIYSFPTRQQCLSAVPPGFANARFVAVGDYELAERCPLLVMERE